jgi:hypothetical protein
VRRTPPAGTRTIEDVAVLDGDLAARQNPLDRFGWILERPDRFGVVVEAAHGPESIQRLSLTTVFMP